MGFGSLSRKTSGCCKLLNRIRLANAKFMDSETRVNVLERKTVMPTVTDANKCERSMIHIIINAHNTRFNQERFKESIEE